MTLPRIGNTQRTKPAMKYANPAGTCSHIGCNNKLRRADSGFFGKYCNPCSRRLIDHGAFNSKVPSLKQEPYASIYKAVRQVVLELIRERNGAIASQASVLERAKRHASWDGIGDPRLARRSDIWLLHHYYHHQLITKERNPIDWLLHMTAVVGVVQLYPQGFETKDQEALFLCKRGLGYKSLPSVRLKKDDTPAPHGRFPLRAARELARRVKSDWLLTSSALELVAKRLLVHC
ncbi:hypothetical protein ACMXYX_03580 [Neptuniibacter sp. QD72_48]|uniref:hypothetical protein n=1 Tax=Neptuniibacter sp. QD72_48 TaxID=3398214 RepID=UPI0039F5ECB7